MGKQSITSCFSRGRDLPYHIRLKGEGNTRIQTYIERGGRFLGLCAGGYYGASSIEFDKGGALEISEGRELGFFPGKAVGPAYKEHPFCYHTEAGSRSAPIIWEGGITNAYFNGGCLFDQAENYPATEVIGRYHDLPGSPAAVIFCKVSLGAALLTGIHPEYTPNLFWNYLLNKILT